MGGSVVCQAFDFDYVAGTTFQSRVDINNYSACHWCSTCCF